MRTARCLRSGWAPARRYSLARDISDTTTVTAARQGKGEKGLLHNGRSAATLSGGTAFSFAQYAMLL